MSANERAAGDPTDEEKYGKIPEQGEFCVYGIVFAKPQHAQTLSDLYSRMTHTALTESGVIYYCISRSTLDPNQFHFFERYRSKTDFEEHVRGEGTQEIFREGYIDR